MHDRILLRLLPAVAALFVLTVVSASSGIAAPVRVALATQNFEGSSSVIANPDRGLFHYTETHSRADGSGYVPLDASAAANSRTREGVTLVYRIFYLERFVATDQLDAAYLGQVSADLEAARAAGVKLIVRFAYSADTSGDAAVTTVVSHIRQLAPVLNANADVIATLQAGFVGRWGEWYYSDHFTADAQRPWALTNANWQSRGVVLEALLTATDRSIFVQVRYPAIKQRLLAGAAPETAARVGIHDDCFLASADDYGTFASTNDYSWLQQQTLTMPMGGETCAVNAPRSQWPSAAADLSTYHWSYLNADFQPEVLRSWGTGGLDEARRRLGYRLRLTQVTVPSTALTGGTVKVQVVLANDGYAAPFRSRPAQLVFQDGKGLKAVAVPIDVRAVAPGRTATFSVSVSAPSRPGSYALSLALPDASARLAEVPSYSIQLANIGTWDAATGRNDLRTLIQVVPS